MGRAVARRSDGPLRKVGVRGRGRRRRETGRMRLGSGRLVAVAVVTALVAGCSGGDRGGDDPSGAGAAVGRPVAVPSGSGPFVLPSRPPDGLVLDDLGRADPQSARGGAIFDGVSVFQPAAEGSGGVTALFAARVPDPRIFAELRAPLMPPTPGERAVFSHPFEPDRLLVDLFGTSTTYVEVWGEGVGISAELERFAADVDDGPSAPASRYRRVSTLPSGWASTGSAVDLPLSRADVREEVTSVSLSRRDLDAVRLLLIDEPEQQLRTAPSVYELGRYPTPTSFEVDGHAATFGMLTAYTSALVVDGDPGYALLTTSRNADDAIGDEAVFRSLVPLLERATTAELDGRASALRDEALDAERRRLTTERPVLWTEDVEGVLRMLVVDASPRYAGPDTEVTKRLRAPCLVAILHVDDVAAHDGCADPRAEVVAAGEVRTDKSGQTPDRTVFALADEDVVSLQLRGGEDVLAEARAIELDEPFGGRRRLFLLDYGSELWVLRDDLALVALDDVGHVLRRIEQDRIGTFEARPGEP